MGLRSSTTKTALQNYSATQSAFVMSMATAPSPTHLQNPLLVSSLFFADNGKPSALDGTAYKSVMKSDDYNKASLRNFGRLT